VIAIDLLPINPLPGAVLLPGCDFTKLETLERIENLLRSQSQHELSSETMPSETTKLKTIDLILSDMAPNATGMKDMDHPRIIKLARSALQFAAEHGKPESNFLTKIWDGTETESFESELETLYKKVIRLKPPCSRNDSSEVFLFAKSKRI
jgi:23S rRNA (uridine2552-2'-O)-methyltransferase